MVTKVNPLVDYNDFVINLASPTDTKGHVVHAAMGLSSEAGEILDNVKAHLYYGKELDVANLLEEAGDILWFLSLLLQQFDYTIEDAVAGNRAKLIARYGDKFNKEGALNRNRQLEIKDMLSKVGKE